MALPRSQILFTEDDYLAMEREAEERHEYIDGNVYEMANESPAHGEIVANLSWIIGSQLKGTPCRTRIGNSGVRSGPLPKSRRSAKGLYSYPDLLVVCGEMEFLDEHEDVLINPAVIIEVLSDSTEKFDRGEKFLRYQLWNPSLSDYILVSQTRPIIEHFSRQPNGSWRYTIHQGTNQELNIESINCLLRSMDVFDRVAFDAGIIGELEEGEE
jgi:Uma2 family endonuclease